MKKLLYSLSLVGISLVASQDEVTRIHSQAIQVHPGLGAVCLSHKNGHFTVAHKGSVSRVAREDSDSTLRDMNADQLRTFLQVGKIRVNRYDNGDYTLTAHGSLKGGGPATANAFYGIVKGTGYALPFAWTIVKLTEGNPQPGAEQIGKAVVKHGGKLMAAKVTADVAAKTAAQHGGTIAYGITQKAGTKVTGEMIGGLATSGGGYFAGVEAIANAAFWVGMAIPWLP